MRKIHVVFDFIQLPISEKIAKGRNVVLEMTDNRAFPNPDVPLIELKNATDELETRYLNSKSGGKEATVLLHQAEEFWADLMRKEARYVERIASDDPAVVLSAGFSLAKHPIPAVRPEFSVEPGSLSGSVVLRRQAVQGAKAYIWQYSANGLSENIDDWTIAQVTAKASAELTNMQPATKYWFRVAVVSTQGTSDYNDPIMHIMT